MAKISSQKKKSINRLKFINHKRTTKPSLPMRVSPEMKQLINNIRAKYLLEGMRPPSITKITEMIAKGVDKDELLRKEFIRF